MVSTCSFSILGYYFLIVFMMGGNNGVGHVTCTVTTGSIFLHGFSFSLFFLAGFFKDIPYCVLVIDLFVLRYQRCIDSWDFGLYALDFCLGVCFGFFRRLFLSSFFCSLAFGIFCIFCCFIAFHISGAASSLHKQYSFFCYCHICLAICNLFCTYICHKRR